ncbi:hypothetical protein, partial [Pantoea sp. Ft+CA_17]|uniref:hypothetical protein n=1 Tax=Pantoea sp. Ft+CA_17 TaxID=2929508 RepID=UPI002118FDFD
TYRYKVKSHWWFTRPRIGNTVQWDDVDVFAIDLVKPNVLLIEEYIIETRLEGFVLIKYPRNSACAISSARPHRRGTKQ